LSVVALNADEYYQVLESSGALGLAGDAIYDAVIGHCALKAKAEAVYTWNTKDFLRLPETICRRVKEPYEQ
jgi:predicted nucleic acid-binding protein